MESNDLVEPPSNSLVGFVGSITASLIALIALFITNMAIIVTKGNEGEIQHSISLMTIPWGFLVAIIAVAYVLVVVFSVRGLVKPRIEKKREIKFASLAALAAILLTLLMGALIALAALGAWDWWIEPAFPAGIICGLLDLVFLKIASDLI